MVQDSFNGSASEMWVFTYNGAGYYTIMSAASNLYLTSGSRSDRSVIQEPLSGWANQLWSLKNVNGNWVIKNMSTNLVLANPGSDTHIGSPVSVYAESDPLWQQWTIN